MSQALVRKRCFVQMTGYEPVGAEHQHRRFIREMARFHKTWNIRGEVSPPVVVRRRRGGKLDGRQLRTELARGYGFSLVSLGRFRAGRRRAKRLVAFFARDRRADGIHSQRNGGEVFHRRVALRQFLSVSAHLPCRHGMAVDRSGAFCGRASRAAVSDVDGALALACDLRRIALYVRTIRPYRLRAR